MVRTIRYLAACVVLAACGATEPEVGPLADLERNRSLWEATRPSSYVFAVERLCFCGVEARGPVRLRVEDDSVTERVYVDTGTPVPETWEDLFPSVDEMFEILRDALEADAHDVTVTYDPLLGVPVQFWIDYAENIADEELGMTVTEAVGPA